MKDHRLIDERSLAFDLLIAEKIQLGPELLQQARNNISRWLETCSPALRPTLVEWQDLLNGPTEGILSLLRATDERAVRLRQSSPFCGILTQKERTSILRDFQDRESLAA